MIQMTPEEDKLCAGIALKITKLLNKNNITLRQAEMILGSLLTIGYEAQAEEVPIEDIKDVPLILVVIIEDAKKTLLSYHDAISHHCNQILQRRATEMITKEGK